MNQTNDPPEVETDDDDSLFGGSFSPNEPLQEDPSLTAQSTAYSIKPCLLFTERQESFEKAQARRGSTIFTRLIENEPLLVERRRSVSGYRCPEVQGY